MRCVLKNDTVQEASASKHVSNNQVLHEKKGKRHVCKFNCGRKFVNEVNALHLLLRKSKCILPGTTYGKEMHQCENALSWNDTSTCRSILIIAFSDSKSLHDKKMHFVTCSATAIKTDML